MLNFVCRQARVRRRLIPALMSPLAILPLGLWGAPAALPLTEKDLLAGKSDWQVVAAECDAPWLAYYDAQGQAQVRNPEGKVLTLAQDHGKTPSKSSGLRMVGLEDGIAVLWRDKYPEKQLYLKRSDQWDADAIAIAGDSQVLPNYEVLRQGSQLHIIWLGELPLPGASTPYHIYYRSLDLAAGTLSPLERIMPGIYPMSAMDVKGNLLVASWNENEENPRIIARYRDSATQTFGPPVVVAEGVRITSLYQVFNNQGRWFVFWVKMNGKSAEDLRLEGAYSDDAGTTWQRFAVDGLGGIEVSTLDMAMNDQGVILMAVNGRYRKDPDDDKRKVYLIRSEDNGSTWSLAPALQSPDALNQFNARFPKVSLGANKGEVLVVWQDWREIRSRLYANFSTDYGKSWALYNLPLPRKPMINQRLDGVGHDLWIDKCGTFHLVSEQADTDLMTPISLIEQRFTTEDLGELTKIPVTVPGKIEAGPEGGSSPQVASTLEDAVRQRASEFWEAMIRKDYPKSYEYYDPFYRAAISSRDYELNLGRIDYEKFEIGEIHITGPVAKVKVNVYASVPNFRVQSTGEVVGQPLRKITLEDKWLWVDDGWYREFYLSALEKRWTKY